MSNILLITQTEGQTKIDIVKNYGELKKISGWQKQLRDQISTDEIYPSKFAHKYEDLGAYALTGLEGKIIGENFLKEKQIEIIIAGENFGIGSSRIHAIQTLKDAGVKLIVAKSFYSVFRKNAINLAFPISENFDLLTKLSHFTTTELAMTKVEEKIIAAGGLINYLATSPKNPTKKNKKYSQTIAEKYLAKYANLPYVKPG
ncbi:MAG: hypothetical protein LBG64_04100, partial [Pseudomonadales bacterium]|nr:hypothetical protein [Pseudomonadales bacterium]